MAGPTYTTHVEAVREVAPEVREITLAPPAERLDFRPGQWLSLQLPVSEHPPLVRAYSLAAPPSPTGELVLCLDRVPGGLGSEYLFTLAPGDRVTFGGPLGNFVLPEGGGDLLWLARYTGIVPFRSMLLHLAEHPPAGYVTLVYSAPRLEDMAYYEELAEFTRRLPLFRTIPVPDCPPEDWTGRSGSVLDFLPELLGDSNPTPMICGKREFVRPLRDFFYARGYERKAVKWENYD